jgi:hypothetical protein
LRWRARACLATGRALPVSSLAHPRSPPLPSPTQGKNHLGGAARAAEDIARQTARELLSPLLDAACARLAFILRRALDLAADKCLKHGEGARAGVVGSATHALQLQRRRRNTRPASMPARRPAGPARDMLQPYVAFHAALCSAHTSFVARLEEQAKALLHHHLDTATSEFALGTLMAALPLELAAPHHQQQPHAAQALGMLPPAATVGRRAGGGHAAAAAAAIAEEGENVAPAAADDDGTQVRGAGCCKARGGGDRVRAAARHTCLPPALTDRVTAASWPPRAGLHGRAAHALPAHPDDRP